MHQRKCRGGDRDERDDEEDDLHRTALFVLIISLIVTPFCGGSSFGILFLRREAVHDLCFVQRGILLGLVTLRSLEVLLGESFKSADSRL